MRFSRQSFSNQVPSVLGTKLKKVLIYQLKRGSEAGELSECTVIGGIP